MIELIGSDPPDRVVLEFDEYVPITATWPAYKRLSSTPTYVRAVEQHRLLELKFDTVSHHLVEFVLVNAPGARTIDEPLSPSVDEKPVTAFWSGVPSGYEYRRLDVAFYQDCALMNFSTDPIRDWRGDGPIFFGVLESGFVGAIGVRWASAENRQTVTR